MRPYGIAADMDQDRSGWLLHNGSSTGPLGASLQGPASGRAVCPPHDAPEEDPLLLLPDKAMILENHHDAGTDAEMTRLVYVAALKLAKRTQGWRPQRT